MRLNRIVGIALIGLPMAGCFGVTLPPKELPDWAMSPQSEVTAPAKPKPARTAEQRRAPERTANVSYVTPTNTPPSAPVAEVTPFSAEWQAREDAFDNKLRRTMNICRGC
jgi:hypothetical protein